MSDPAEFVAKYRATWKAVIGGTAPVERLTGFFHLPCLMLSVDGELSEYRDESELRAFNEGRRAAFAKGGAVTARTVGADITSQGPHLALATVNWQLHRADGSLERAWRHYYTLRQRDGRWSILISTFQTGS